MITRAEQGDLLKQSDTVNDDESENVVLLKSEQGIRKEKPKFDKKFVLRFFESLEGFFQTEVFPSFGLFLTRQRHFVIYNLREIWKRKCGYCLGMLSCVLVVLAVVAVASVVEQLPLIFLRIGENERGQFDLKVSSNTLLGHHLNYTLFVESIRHGAVTEKKIEEYSLLAPRIIFSAYVYKYSECGEINGKVQPIWDDGNSRDEVQWMYGYIDSPVCRNTKNERIYCVPEVCKRKSDINVIAYDTKKEEKMKFGRDWEYPKLKIGECIISKTLADDLGLGVGDDVIVYSTLFSHNYGVFLGFLKESGVVGINVTEDWKAYEKTAWHFFIPMKIVAVDRSLQGKNDHRSEGDDVLFFEYETIYEHIGKYIDKKFDNYRDKMMKVNPYYYARYIYVNNPDRMALYGTSDYETVKIRITSFCGDFLFLAGIDQVNAEYPLLMFLRGVRMIGLFLSLIVNIIITILVGLSVILVYSLLMINVDERTFEMGVLRMVGLKLSGLMEIILMQSLLYSVPGVLIGLFVGEIIYLIVSIFLRAFLKAPIPYFLTYQSVLIGVPLGFLIPLLGSIIPIRKAMGKSLQSSLDSTRSKTKAVKVKIERQSDSTISFSSLIFAICSFTFGFFVYYFFPLAMITQRFDLLLTLFFILILLMLAGCVMLSLNVEGIIQNILTKIIFFWEYASVKKLIVKNLIAHKRRNRKTTIMYGISLGFLIFISVSTRLEIKMYEYTTYRLYGTKLLLECRWGRKWDKDLNHKKFQESFDDLVQRESLIEDYASISFPLSELTNDTTYRLRTIGGYWYESTDLSAVSPNFYEVLDDEYLNVFMEENTGWSVSEHLYSLTGRNGIMGGTAQQKDLGTTKLNENLVYEMSRNTEMYKKYAYYLVRYDSVLDSGAASTFSKYDNDIVTNPLGSGKHGVDGFVSFPSLLKIMEHDLEKRILKVEDIPIRYIYMKISEDASQDEVDLLKYRIKHVYQSVGLDNIRLFDTNERIRRIAVVDTVLTVFFYLSTTLAMIMCFFSLVANMFINVAEQSKEIGILRAIGCRKCTLRRIYVYESLVLIYTAAVIGIVIGTFVGYTLVLQQQLFTQLPLGFVFPTEIVVIVFVVGIVCGFLSSIFPINMLLRKTPVGIMRSG